MSINDTLVATGTKVKWTTASGVTETGTVLSGKQGEVSVALDGRYADLAVQKGRRLADFDESGYNQAGFNKDGYNVAGERELGFELPLERRPVVVVKVSDLVPADSADPLPATPGLSVAPAGKLNEDLNRLPGNADPANPHHVVRIEEPAKGPFVKQA